MDPLSGLLKAGASLTLVLGLMALSVYFMKRFFGSRLGLGRSGPLIQVLARTYLGAKKEIALIEVGEEVLVVGITPNQISLLTRLEPSFLPASFSQKIKESNP